MRSKPTITITVHESQQSLAGSVWVGRKFAATKPYVAKAYTDSGKFVGYVNLLDLFKQC